MDARESARIYLLQVPPAPAEITSNGILSSLFTKLSGITHNQLLVSWGKARRPDPPPPAPPVFRADPPPGLTSCNGFVGLYGNATGIAQKNRSLGQFNLENKVKSWGAGYAWVPSTAGARPKFGDIFELATRLHMGISLDFDGDTWNTAEGGQGGSLRGFDIIKRKRARQTSNIVTTEKGETLKGWVDIDLFVNGPPPTTVPGWLLGWWAVPWRGRTFFYLFDASFKVSWTFTKPISSAFAPLRFDDTATVTMDSAQSITLKWNATGSVEKFTQTGISGQMVGMWNGIEPLSATKLF